MKPADCVDQYDSTFKLQEQGIRINETSLTVQPNVVVLEHQSTTIRIPMYLFKKLATWYLEDQ